jgi:hypothetical protein
MYFGITDGGYGCYGHIQGIYEGPAFNNPIADGADDYDEEQNACSSDEAL